MALLLSFLLGKGAQTVLTTVGLNSAQLLIASKRREQILPLNHVIHHALHL